MVASPFVFLQFSRLFRIVKRGLYPPVNFLQAVKFVKAVQRDGAGKKPKCEGDNDQLHAIVSYLTVAP